VFVVPLARRKVILSLCPSERGPGKKKKPTGDSKDFCYQGEVVVATKILIIIIYGAAGSHSSAD
jgi:hypothetical protein